MHAKIAYHTGPTFGLRSKALNGVLSLANGALAIQGSAPVDIPLETIRRAELFRLHGVGTMIRVIHEDGVLFVTVPRFNFRGIFLVINWLRTRELRAALIGAIDALPCG